MQIGYLCRVVKVFCQDYSNFVRFCTNNGALRGLRSAQPCVDFCSPPAPGEGLQPPQAEQSNAAVADRERGRFLPGQRKVFAVASRVALPAHPAWAHPCAKAAQLQGGFLRVAVSVLQSTRSVRAKIQRRRWTAQHVRLLYFKSSPSRAPRVQGGFFAEGPSAHTVREGLGEKSNAAIAARSRQESQLYVEALSPSRAAHMQGGFCVGGPSAHTVREGPGTKSNAADGPRSRRGVSL